MEKRRYTRVWDVSFVKLIVGLCIGERQREAAELGSIVHVTKSLSNRACCRIRYFHNFDGPLNGLIESFRFNGKKKVTTEES